MTIADIVLFGPLWASLIGASFIFIRRLYRRKKAHSIFWLLVIIADIHFIILLHNL